MIAVGAAVLLFGTSALPRLSAQPRPSGTGVILWQGLNIKGPGGRSALARKRFFLYSGTLSENKALVDAVKAADITSRNCYYAGAKASACLINWLEEENCESPFCRKITQDDVASVPEFKAAFDKGLASYGSRSDLALDWIFDSMPPDLLSGYALKRRALLEQLQKQFPFKQEVISSRTAQAQFVGLAPGTYVVTNLIPIEINKSSYVWAYEATVSANKTVSLRPSLTATAAGGVFVQKELKQCMASECPGKG